MILNKKTFLMALAIVAQTMPLAAQKQWTLKECLDYALENNLQVQKGRVSEQQGDIALWQDQGALFPSLSFATSQNVGFRPFEESTALVQNGQVTMTSNKWTYSGNYGLSANWTVWNGGINQKTIKAQRLQNQITQLSTRQSELSIQEQIAQLYVQILYSTEAMTVNRQLAETAQKQYERGQQMQQQGQMSKADVAQLEAQWKSAQYDIVNSETQVQNYKRQLKALLELGIDTPFDVAGTEPTDEQVLSPIPSAQSVYEQAVQSRPEIRSAELSIDAADMSIDIARRGYYPTIGVSASAGDSHYSASQDNAGEQMKRNLNLSAGVNVTGETEQPTGPAGPEERPVKHHRELLAQRQQQPAALPIGQGQGGEPGDELRTAERPVPEWAEEHRRTAPRPRQPGHRQAGRTAKQVHHPAEHTTAEVLQWGSDKPISLGNHRTT